MSTEGAPQPRTYPVPDEVARTSAAALRTSDRSVDTHTVSEFELRAARKYVVDGEITSEDASSFHRSLVASAAGSTVYGLLGGDPARAWLGLLLNEISAGGDGTAAITAAGMRRVRTPKGADYYNQPVGSPIVPKPRKGKVRVRTPKSSGSSNPDQIRLPLPGVSTAGSTKSAAPKPVAPKSKLKPAGANSGAAKPKNPGTKSTSSSDADLHGKTQDELNKIKDPRPYDYGIYWDGHTRKAKEHKDKGKDLPNPRDVVDGANGGGMGGGMPGKPKLPKGSTPAAGKSGRGSGSGDTSSTSNSGESKGSKSLPAIEKVSSGRGKGSSSSIPESRRPKSKKVGGLNQAETDHGGKMVKLHGDETRSYGLDDARRGQRNESVDASPGLRAETDFEDLKKRYENRRLKEMRDRLKEQKSSRKNKG